MMILDSNRYTRDPAAAAAQVSAIIEEAGGEVLVSRLWEERRLAYPLQGHRKGTYWLTYFRLAGPKVAEIRRRCYLSENILRVLFLRVDPRLVDILVEHARTGQVVTTIAPPEPERPPHAPAAAIVVDEAVVEWAGKEGDEP
jgi:small subunit ribosomal protein S6